MGTWTNDDGLHIKYGTDRGVSVTNEVGEYLHYGDAREIELEIDLTELTETEKVLSDTLIIPGNSRIEKVEVYTLTGATTGTAIDVGLINIDRSSTGDTHAGSGGTDADPNAILAAFATATMDEVGEHVVFLGAGDSIPASITTVGTAVGNNTLAPCLVTASRTDSTAFGAGKIALRLWIRPLEDSSVTRLSK